MDKATIVGLILGIVFLVNGIGISSLYRFYQFSSLLITFGGTIGSIFITFTWEQVLGTIKIASKTFKTKPLNPIKIIDTLVRLAEKSRKEGILSIDKELPKIDIPFLVKGLQLVVDGSDKETVEQMMTIEIDATIDRHRVGINLFETLGALAPSWGMIGTIIGLIQMLSALSDPSAIGPAMATALLTTLYGAVGAFLFFAPMAGKLKIRSEEEMFAMNMILSGVQFIQAGDNPRTIKEKLSRYLAPKNRIEDKKNDKKA